AGALAAEENRVVGGEGKAGERLAAGRGQQHEARPGVAGAAEVVPRSVATNRREREIVERGAPQPPVVEQEAARLDQIDPDPKTGGQAQQRTGILRDVGLE